MFFTLICSSCEKIPTRQYEEGIVGWWEWDLRENSGVRFERDGSACFWDDGQTFDSFGWWLEGRTLCTREWTPGDSGAPDDKLCSWTGNPNCYCHQEGGRHITTIVKLTDSELILNIDDDDAFDSDYDMPSQIKLRKLQGVE